MREHLFPVSRTGRTWNIQCEKRRCRASSVNTIPCWVIVSGVRLVRGQSPTWLTNQPPVSSESHNNSSIKASLSNSVISSGKVNLVGQSCSVLQGKGIIRCGACRVFRNVPPVSLSSSSLDGNYTLHIAQHLPLEIPLLHNLPVQCSPSPGLVTRSGLSIALIVTNFLSAKKNKSHTSSSTQNGLFFICIK